MASALVAVTPLSAAAAPPGKGEVGEAAARSAAVAAGHRVEATALRTDRQQVFANPDGTFTLQQFVVPVRVRRGTGWVPVDTNLRPTSSAMVAPGATTLDVAFSAGGTFPLVSLRRRSA
ncbi:hypothetical protein ACL02O_13315 [Micromonospora sp. MS34]|uniref:hypothetical protein n=1 Tax=Micromonospora sp. MS34 TaxID=3385971 RepID=UPI0039A00FCE